MLVNAKLFINECKERNYMLKTNNKVIEKNNEKSNLKSKTKKWEINHMIDEHLITNRKHTN